MQHAMISVRATGYAPGSSILTIGAVRFNPFEDDLTPDWRHIADSQPARVFYRRIDRASNVAAGLVDDEETLVAIAMQAEVEDIAEMFGGDQPRAPLPDALRDLRHWLCAPMPADHKLLVIQRRPVAVWGCLAGIDIGLLDAAYRAVSQPKAWTWRDIRDAWTLLDYADIARPGPTPHAMADAIAYAAAVQRAYSQRVWGEPGQ